MVCVDLIDVSIHRPTPTTARVIRYHDTRSSRYARYFSALLRIHDLDTTLERARREGRDEFFASRHVKTNFPTSGEIATRIDVFFSERAVYATTKGYLWC